MEEKKSIFKKDFKILLVAIFCGVLAIILLNIYINSKNKGKETKAVLVAKRDISKGVKIEENMIGEAQYPNSLYMSGMTTPGNKKAIEGLISNIDIYKDAPLWLYYFSDKEELSSEKLNKSTHERIIQIKIKGSIGGITPGIDYIDIFINLSEPSKVTKLLMQRIPVVGHAGDELLLRVYPDEAGLLFAAEQAGELMFIYRNPQDFTPIDPDMEFSPSDILPKAKKAYVVRQGNESREIK